MQVRGNFAVPPGFPLDADPKEALDIVWTHSMQFDDLALIVRLQNAYCNGQVKRPWNYLMYPTPTAKGFARSKRRGLTAKRPYKAKRMLCSAATTTQPRRTSRSSDATSTRDGEAPTLH